MAHAMTELLLQYGEQDMNQMGKRLANEQVAFIEKQVEQLENRLDQSTRLIVAYQNRHGLVSPTGTVESMVMVVAQLEGELAQLSARKKALSSYQSKHSPSMVLLNAQIKALQKQIQAERSRMATQKGNALNVVSAEYERLQLQAKLAMETYSSGIEILENTRVEAIRKLKSISALQNPTYPKYPEKPDRVYNIAVFTIFAMMITGIAWLMGAIIKDHRD